MEEESRKLMLRPPIGNPYPVHVIVKDRPEHNKPIIRVLWSEVMQSYYGLLIGNWHGMPDFNGHYDNRMGTIFLFYKEHLTIHIKYEFESFDEYHERTGKGHPDAKARETAQKGRAL